MAGKKKLAPLASLFSRSKLGVRIFPQDLCFDKVYPVLHQIRGTFDGIKLEHIFHMV